MERVEGIEPSWLAWEARTLPLSYTRPVPKDGLLPKERFPFGLVGADLSRDRPPHGSQRLFRPGRSLHPLSEPLQPGVRFFRDPLPATQASDFTTRIVILFSVTLLRAYPVPCKEHEPGGLRLSAGDRFVSVPPPSRGTSDHTPFGLSLSVDLAHSSLTTFISGSLDISPLAQPSASSGFDYQNHATTLTGSCVPEKGGYIVSALGTGLLPTPHCT